MISEVRALLTGSQRQEVDRLAEEFQCPVYLLIEPDDQPGAGSRVVVAAGLAGPAFSIDGGGLYTPAGTAETDPELPIIALPPGADEDRS